MSLMYFLPFEKSRHAHSNVVAYEQDCRISDYDLGQSDVKSNRETPGWFPFIKSFSLLSQIKELDHEEWWFTGDNKNK
jgi:hypothetical protein